MAGPNFSYAGWNVTFDEEFDSLSLWNGTSGRWKTSFYNGDRTLFGNGELEVYTDPTFQGSADHPLGVDPFSIDAGILTITAKPTDPDVKPFVGNIPYTSGLLTTQQSFAQLYGYFEARVKAPPGKGVWPAFWLLPLDKSWPPEMDVFEILGQKTTEVFHGSRAVDASLNTGGSFQGIDSADGFHTYGMSWEPDGVKWYIDGVEVGTAPNPSDKPMYVLTNLAVGGLWPGSPDATTPLPAQYQVDYIRAYQHVGDPGGPVPIPSASPSPAPAPAPAPPPVPDPMPVPTGPRESGATQAWHLGADAATAGNGRNEYFDGGGAVHMMNGGAGDDVYVVYTATDQIIEQPNAGVDSVSAWTSYVLPDNVENLTLLPGPATDATGNALANILRGNGNANTIDGGAGDDLLTGGGGADMFLVAKGNGSDTITDFQAGAVAGDVVKLQGYGFADFAAVQAAMTQNGADVALALGGGETLTFQGHAIADFAADDFGFAAAAPTPSPTPVPAPTPTPTPVPTPTPAPAPTPPSADGQAHESGPVQNWFLGVNAAKPGTSGNDYFDGAATMAGGAGDDHYVVHAATDTISEAANAGIDSVTSFVSYTLPDNVDNLELLASPAAFATGNALANILTGNNNANIIDGGAGNDLLFGGGGADTFIVSSGNGSDTIGDFAAGSGAGDIVKLQGYGFADFAAIQAAMTQNGADTVLALGGNETLTFGNHLVADFASDDFGFAAATPSPAPAPAPAPTPAPTPVPAPPPAPDGDGPAATPSEPRSYIAPDSTGTAHGTAGADDIFASGDNQTLIGGGGNDVFHIGTHAGLAIQETNPGISTIATWLGSYTLQEGIDNLAGDGSIAHSLTGNAGNNAITGNSGNDTLNGGGGHDLLVGGGGADIFVLASLDNAGSHVADFAIGSDHVDLRPFLGSVGYAGADPFADGTVQLAADGDGTDVAYAAPGGAPITLVTLDHVAPSTLHPIDFLH